MSDVINVHALSEALGLGSGHEGWTDPGSLQGLFNELRLAEQLVQARLLDVRINIQDEKSDLVKRVRELEIENEKLNNPLIPLIDRIEAERAKEGIPPLGAET